MTQMRTSRREFSAQQGAALMVMLVIMVLGTAAFLVSSLKSSAIVNSRDAETDKVLAQARDALIGYAATYGDNHSGDVHGYLPCPDEGQNGSQDGEANTSCGSTDVSRLGKLPWRTLGLQPLKDGNGECLWYAVSGTYKNNPQTLMMNDDTIGLFEVLAADGVNHIAGANIDDRAVAIIFAPGNVQNGKNHSSVAGAPSCGGNYTASNYLDNDTIHSIDNAVISTSANALSQFISGPVKASGDTTSLRDTLVNDRMIVITKSDIFNAIKRRADFADPARNPLLLMTKKAAECIADYGRNNNDGPSDKRLPWSGRPAPAIGSDCTYRDSSSSSSPTNVMFGRLPNRVSVSRSATDNDIPQKSCSGGSSSYYQLRSDSSGCPSVSDWSTYYPWWSNWKDHVFYTVSNSYRPAASNNPSCGTCLKVNGGSAIYSAIVMFAGEKLASQSRATDADRIDFSNYLEGSNLVSNTPISTSGNGDYQTGAATSSFNDALYCIKSDLSVVPCP